MCGYPGGQSRRRLEPCEPALRLRAPCRKSLVFYHRYLIALRTILSSTPKVASHGKWIKWSRHKRYLWLEDQLDKPNSGGVPGPMAAELCQEICVETAGSRQYFWSPRRASLW